MGERYVREAPCKASEKTYIIICDPKKVTVINTFQFHLLNILIFNFLNFKFSIPVCLIANQDVMAQYDLCKISLVL